MSDKDRKKKDGQRKDKKNERMREDIRERKERGEANLSGETSRKEAGLHSDQGDVVSKPNSEMIGGPSQPQRGKPG